MSQIYNQFQYNLEEALIQLLRTWFQTNYDDANRVNIVQPAQEERVTFPMVIVAVTDSSEAVYKSGIYSVLVDFVYKTDLDGGNPEQARKMFAAVLDFCQQNSLWSQLNAVVDNTNKLLVKIVGEDDYANGVVIQRAALVDTGDRQWIKTLTVQFVGYTPTVD